MSIGRAILRERGGEARLVEPFHGTSADEGDGHGAPAEREQLVVRTIVLVNIPYLERHVLA